MENEAAKKETSEVKAAETKPTEAVVVENPEHKHTTHKKKARKAKMSTGMFFTLVCIITVVIGLGVYIVTAKKGWFVAAIVNGTSISRFSVIEELEKRGGKDVLDAIITKKLLADEAKRLGVVVKNEDIDAEVKKVEDQMVAQGSTLDAALLQQGMTRQDLTDQILINKQLEQILGDKVKVSEEDIDQYLKDNKMTPPKGTSATDMRERVRQQLGSQKFSTEAKSFVESLRTQASIERYAGY